MPIYEYLCRPCNRIFSFHSFKVDPQKRPTCPRCGGEEMKRVPSRFGIRRAASPSAGGSEPDLDDPRVEREMMKLAAELEGMDEDDPRQMAQAVRRMAELSGEPVTPTMEEMIRRLEAGEDPEQVEEELGAALEEEMGGALGGADLPPPTRDEGLYPM